MQPPHSHVVASELCAAYGGGGVPSGRADRLVISIASNDKRTVPFSTASSHCFSVS